MGEHIDSRKKGAKRKRGFTEGVDVLARKQRVTFKNYIRDLEEELLEDDFDGLDDLDNEETDNT